MAKILVVEDDENLSRLVKICLSSESYLVDSVMRGMDALAQIRLITYDMLVLDWMLPDITGVEVLKHYRASGGRAPVLMLTSRSTVADKVTGLEAGADDYLVKPFDKLELAARVKALLRRPKEMNPEVLVRGSLEINQTTFQVIKDGQEVELRPKEFALLEFLAKHPGESFSAEAILERLWRSDALSTTDTVRTHIMTLRKKLGDNDTKPLIKTVRGRGYSLQVNTQD
ncbi:MAG: response regulator transcription factor [Cyanobacteria bacterium SZAS LIN-3]|nr:response regulator transcription factor [Cyanobacteria bacterium SZAS LIN-3]MBS2008832.1 response regulator transcription factor [Cyanobacteria bacterium SZAS TMP-1]